METARNGAAATVTQTWDTWEEAVLDGGPAHGLRVRVVGRPRVLQVTHPCLVDQDTPAAPAGAAPLRVEALHVYRRDPQTAGAPLRYGFDPASP
ncbi:hypothetical protein ABZ901_27075 [Actinacidiphila alni]|uniref:hypothetical protein n=1 Tax=Actinacidiphila alni TaxID=380248 RepID=UPI0033D7274B